MRAGGIEAHVKVGERRGRDRWTEGRISEARLGAELRSWDPWDPPAGAPGS